MVRASLSVRPSVRTCPKLSKTDVWLLRIWASRFRICHQIRDRKYGSAIWDISGLALRPFRQKWGSWPSEWIGKTPTSPDTRLALHVSSCASLYAQFIERKGQHNHTGHRGGPVIVTSHSGRFLLSIDGCQFVSLNRGIGNHNC